MQYLVWRALTKRYTHITLSFLPVGHSKFSPDWCFGFFKHLYRRTRVGSLQAIAHVANNSAECNFAQLVSRKGGSTFVPSYLWTDFFAMKIPGIKKLHHFQVTASSPGKVFVREWFDSPEVALDLLKEPREPDADELPMLIAPHGLSAERQWYLHEQIRPFCPEEDKDSMCPLPSVPKPGGSRQGTPLPEEGSVEIPPSP